MNKLILAAIVVVLATIGSAYAQDAGIGPRQKQDLKRLAEETRVKADRERDALRRARMELALVYREYDLDDRRARSAIDKINNGQLDLLNVHLYHQIGVRDILNPGQFAAFNKLLRKAAAGDQADLMPPPEDALADKLPDSRMLNTLQLDSAQRQRAQRLIGPGPEKAKVIGKLQENARRMMAIYDRYDLDVPAAKKLVEEIHRNQVELSVVNHEKQRTLRSVLTQSQFSRLQQLIESRIREMRKDRKGPPTKRPR